MNNQENKSSESKAQVDPFANLKQICDAACHDRHACAKGYKQMLESKDTVEMMNTWRDNWEDIVESKYADIIRRELPAIYPELKAQMNKAQIFLNECPESAGQYTKVLVTDTDNPVRIYGRAKAYILGKAKVIAHDHTQVYNYKQQDAEVKLLGYAYGHIMAGKVEAEGRSSLSCNCQAILSGAVFCTATGGTVRAKGYREVEAYGDTKVVSYMTENITLNDNAQLVKPEED